MHVYIYVYSKLCLRCIHLLCVCMLCYCENQIKYDPKKKKKINVKDKKPSDFPDSSNNTTLGQYLYLGGQYERFLEPYNTAQHMGLKRPVQNCLKIYCWSAGFVYPTLSDHMFITFYSIKLFSCVKD